METKIIYTYNKNGYAKIKDGILIIEIPFFLKHNKNFINSLIRKGEKLFEKQKKLNNIMSINQDSVLLFGEYVKKSELPGKLDQNLKNILLEYVSPLVDLYSDRLGYKYNAIRIGKAKTKRGSCTFDQKLMFNINLIHLPTKYIKYVIIHEVCHLKHKNHSTNFWDEVSVFMPDYKNIKKELRKMIII